MLVVVGATVVLAGQPIYANDTWIHLSLGEVFARSGPWLERDPFLFAAPGPPEPSSWLGSVAIFEGFAVAGFDGLRLLHALAVLGLLVLAWIAFRRTGSSPGIASAGTLGFVALSTYRIVQLRPELFTLVATLALVPLAITPREGPGPRRIAVAALVAAVWANVHAAFLLGPVLMAAAAVGVAGAALLPRLAGRATDADSRVEWTRARRLATTALAMGLASLLNPQGPGAHLAYLRSGERTLDLGAIADEWNPTNLLAWPVPFLPPTVAAWSLCWLAIAAAVLAGLVLLRERTRGAEASAGPSTRSAHVDPALLALAGAGLVAAASASRFLWLAFFALAALGALASRVRRPGLALAFAAAVALLHFREGDWPLVSRNLLAEGSDYAVPYSAERFNTEAIWFLADTGVEGRIFNDYPLGGFMAFWLAPKLQMASSGTMNVAKDAMEANLAIAARQRMRPDESYAALLDRMGFDLFLGLGFPIEATPGRPIPCTVRHLEHEPGWILVFRNLRNAVYLRRDERNAANLERIARYYERAGVPFDRERGFEPERVVRSATGWALSHGLIPYDFESLIDSVRQARREGQMDPQAHRLALIYAVLGLYDRALALDRAILREYPTDPLAAWRIIWSLAQLGRLDEALEVARSVEQRARAGGSEVTAWSATVEKLKSADPEARATLLAHLPVVRPDQLDWLRHGIAIAPARSDRSSTDS